MNTGYIARLGVPSSMSNPFSNTLGSTGISAHISNLPGFGNTLPAVGPLGMSDNVKGVPSVQATSFKDVLSNTMSSVNETLRAPDALMQDAMLGGSADVHDVMIANAKAELVINIASQMTTKVIQAYDRILQIQI